MESRDDTDCLCCSWNDIHGSAGNYDFKYTAGMDKAKLFKLADAEAKVQSINALNRGKEVKVSLLRSYSDDDLIKLEFSRSSQNEVDTLVEEDYSKLIDKLEAERDLLLDIIEEIRHD